MQAPQSAGQSPHVSPPPHRPSPQRTSCPPPDPLVHGSQSAGHVAHVSPDAPSQAPSPQEPPPFPVSPVALPVSSRGPEPGSWLLDLGPQPAPARLNSKHAGARVATFLFILAP